MSKKSSSMMTAIVVVVILVAVITLIMMYKPSAEPPGGIVPELEVSGTKTVSSTKISGYAMRYEYEVGTFLGDNIDFDITIKTRGGFEELSLTGLNVYRYTKDGDTRIELSVPPIEIKAIKNYTTYVTKFTGLQLKRDAVPPAGGKNFFEVRAIRDGTEVSGDDKVPDVLAATVDGVAITNTDLNYILNEPTTSTFPWSVTDATAFQAGVGLRITSVYRLSIVPDKNVKITYDDPTTKTMFIFTYMDSSNEKFTVEGKSVFKLEPVIGKPNVYYLYTPDGPDSKIVTKDANNVIVLRKPGEMDAALASAANVTITDMGMSSTGAKETDVLVAAEELVKTTDTNVNTADANVDCVLGDWYTFRYSNGQVCNNTTKQIQEKRDVLVEQKNSGAACGVKTRLSPCPVPTPTNNYSGPFKVSFPKGNQLSAVVRVVAADNENNLLGTATIIRGNFHTFNAVNWPGRIKVLIGLASGRKVNEYGVVWPLTREAGDNRVITSFPANREESMGDLIPTLYFTITD